MTDEPIYLSATSADKLLGCENRYVLDKVIRSGASEQEAKSVPLRKGTLIHRLTRAWYLGRDWQAEYQAALDEDPYWEEGFEPDEEFPEAFSIMADWVTFYGDTPDATILATELPFVIPVPGVSGVFVRGFLDQVLAIEVDDNRTHDRIIVQETKTMGRWGGREKLAPEDPQVLLYEWAASKMFPVSGVRFDAISTYPYKDPQPAKRFKRIEFDYREEQVEDMVQNLVKVARRAKQLHRNPDLATKHVSVDSCKWCPHVVPCRRPWELR